MDGNKEDIGDREMKKTTVLKYVFIISFMLVIMRNNMIVHAQPIESNSTPIYLPELVDDPAYPETLAYSNLNSKENMKGFYSNYTRMFHWFGDMGINYITHADTSHSVVGYAYSPDGVNWNIDRTFGIFNDLVDYSVGVGYFDVVLETNGRYFWIVALNAYHGEPYPILARSGELLLNGSISWRDESQTIVFGLVASKKPTYPIDAEVDSNGRLFVSFNAWWVSGGNQYFGYVRWTDLTNGTFSYDHQQLYDDLLDWNKGDIVREYLKLNRLADGKMAWTGIFDSAGGGIWFAETVYFTGTNWILDQQKRLFSSLASEGNMYRKVDIVSYGDRLVGAYVRRESGFQKLSVEEAIYNTEWVNRTILVDDYYEHTGINTPHLTTTWEGNVVLWIYRSGDNTVNYTYRFSNHTWELTFINMFNDTWANYQWDRFSFQDTVNNFMPFWFQDNATSSYAELGFHYFSWNGSMLPLLFEYHNTTLYGDYHGWIFKGEVYTIESYITNPSYFAIKFSDGRNDISLVFENNSKLMYSKIYTEIGRNESVCGLINGEYVEYADNLYRLRWTFIPNINIVDALNVNITYYINYEPLNMVFTGNTNITINIYNLGGFTTYDFDGDSNKIVGGDSIEIHHTESIGTGGYVDQIWRRLQHTHLLFSLDVEDNDCFDIHENTGKVMIGIKYLDVNGSWVDGWYFELSIVNGAVDAGGGGLGKAWIIPYVAWYSMDENGTVSNRKIDILSGYPECGDKVGNDITYTRFYVDLWFNKGNYSTTVGGRVSPFYYGMDETGWLLWSNWSPVMFNFSESMFFDDLRNANGEIIHSRDIELMKFWVRVLKVGSGTGEDCDNHQWSLRNPKISYNYADDRMESINTPDGVETLVVDMPSSGWLQPIAKAISGISSLIWKGALGFIKVLWGAMDTFFEWIGIEGGFFTKMVEFILALPDIAILIISQLELMINSMLDVLSKMLGIIALAIYRVIYMMGMLVTTFTSYWGYFVSLFSGGITGIGNIWEDFSMAQWIELFIIAILPFYHLTKWTTSKTPLMAIKEDASMYWGILNGIWDITRQLIEVVMLIIGVIRKLLPI